MAKRFALVVGINDYADAENIQGLRFAVEDARQVDRFFHACGFDVRTLTDSEANCEAIERHLRDISSRLQPQDTFLFYYSGHGYQWGAAGEERQYLLPRDVDLWALRRGGAGRAIPMRFVEEATNGHGARRAVILDACRSGLHPGERGEAALEDRLSSRDIEAVATSAPATSPLLVVCSCRPQQLSFEHGGLRGGLFTAAMLSVFSDLRKEGRSIAFTTETNKRVSDRMQGLAAQMKLDPGKVGDIWTTGEGTGLELVPGNRPQNRNGFPSPLAIADPEKAEVKEFEVEDLHVEVERLEVVTPSTHGDLPPVPEEILDIQAELAGLDLAAEQLRTGKHISLVAAKDAVRQAEAQLQTFQEDLIANEIPLPKEVRNTLEKAIHSKSQARPSIYCDLAPQVVPGELLPFVARLRNAHRAELALEAVRSELGDAIERNVSEIEKKALVLRSKLQILQDQDLDKVLFLLWPNLRDADLVEVWSSIESQFMARGYNIDSRSLLDRVESFLAHPGKACIQVSELMAKGELKHAEEYVDSLLTSFSGHDELEELKQEIADKKWILQRKKEERDERTLEKKRREAHRKRQDAEISHRKKVAEAARRKKSQVRKAKSIVYWSAVTILVTIFKLNWGEPLAITVFSLATVAVASIILVILSPI